MEARSEDAVPRRPALAASVADRLLAPGWQAEAAELPGAELAVLLRRRARRAVIAANATGAGVVACFALFALPRQPHVDVAALSAVDLGLAAAYLLAAIAAGLVWARRRFERGPDSTLRWLEADLPPDARQRRAALRMPLQIMVAQVLLWGLAAVLFAAVDVWFSPLAALGIGLTIVIGGLTTSTAAYLAAELVLRPLAARALATGATSRAGVPGVAVRWMLAWALGTGAPVVGLVALGIVGLTGARPDETSLAVTVLVLGVVALGFGALVTALAAFATVVPIDSIRHGLDRVGAGDLAVTVPAWDTTEMGLLQSGFNEMVAGLRERERIRDIFGRQVGRQAAQQALAVDDPQLGGELASVTVLFVDVIGSTRLAATTDPRDVVGLLNAFFGHVVSVVESHGGWINKFQGDAALAIFGAPAPLPGREAAALSAARELVAVVNADPDGLTVAAGVASGEVVAGHVGAESRFEYTVIGDPVNAAARLTELAKQRSLALVADAETVAAAGPAEAARWRETDAVTLRGRPEPTRLSVPR